MDEAKKEYYHERLLALKNETERLLLETAATYAPVELNGAMGRVSRGDAIQNQQMALEMKRRREQLLLRIQSALTRIGQGAYGLCGRCRQPISGQRLKAQPDVVLCIACAQNPGPNRK